MTNTRKAFVDDPSLAAAELSRAELEATLDEPWRLTRMSFGKALERSVGRDPSLVGMLEPVGGAGLPDFIDTQGLGYEITTSNPGTVASHLRRPYVDPTRLATYEPPPDDFTFGTGTGGGC